MARRRSGAAVVAAAMTAAIGLPLGLPGATAAQQPVAGKGAGPAITLVTGDRVQLHGAQPPSVDPGPGRDKVSFRVYKDRGDTYVIPADAAGLVSSGRVDRRLFNVSKLLQSGYAGHPGMPLIVTGSANRVRTLSAARELPSISGAAVVADAAGSVWRSLRGGSPAALDAGVSKVWLDAKVTANLDHSVPQIGAPAAWQAGNTGKGSKVAVLDTGIDNRHADLADAVVADKDFTESESGTADRFGHGTHVASIITGSGAASAGKYKGVAPDTQLLNGKVLGDDGGGSESGIIAGMEWAAEQGADVVNMSLGSSFPGLGDEPMELAINRLTETTGTLYIVAAGNNGSDEGVSSPADADAALAVGAVDRDDNLAPFSARGPRWRDGALKPEITGPGVGIVAAKATDSVIGTPVGTDYLQLSGTSMATPHVAGAAAILAGQHPDWKADQLRAVLMGTAEPNPALTVFQQGAGRVDVARASGQAVRSDAGSLWLGTALWPHADDVPIVRTVTYTNDGGTPVTLALSSDLRDPTGKPAPAGMFVLSANSITVPAHGTASVTLTTNTKVEGPDGTYTGTVTAVSGGTSVRTTVGVIREVESYDVKLKYVDWDGRPAPEAGHRFVSIAKPKAYLPPITDGSSVARLPKGTYYYESGISKVVGEDPFKAISTDFGEPALVVDGPKSLTLDARDGKAVAVRSADHPEAAQGAGYISSIRDTDWGGKASTGYSLITNTFDGISFRPSQTSAAGAYQFVVEGHLAKPDEDGGFTGSPYNYHLGFTTDGRIPAELDRGFRDRDLATSTARIAAQVPGEVVVKDSLAQRPGPAEVVERFTPGVQFGFWANVSQWKDWANGEVNWSQYALPPSYAKTGPKPASHWNLGPFGPGFAAGVEASSVREGDWIGVDLPLHSPRFANQFGYSVAEGSTRLLKDGTELAKSEWPGFLEPVQLAPERATYRLEAEATRDSSPLSTKVSAAWTFQSEHVPGEDVRQALDLLAVRFAPRLDDLNRAPAGRPFAVPLYVQGQGGGTYGKVKAVEVQASYDDGATWHKARVIGSGDHRTALLNHPRRADFVSLKATATDALGNKVEQTVIHAYQLR